MLLKIIFGFGLLFLAEISVMALVARFFGAVTVILIIALTALAGALIISVLRPAAMLKIRSVMTGSALPGEGIFHTILLFVAGVLLIAPGIIADILGILLLIPGIRKRVSGVARKYAERAINRGKIRVTRINQGNPWQK